MKKTISTITLGLLFSLSSFATVFTVNNSTTTPGNPGQYTTIQDAFTAASPGDTLLVKGSTTTYNVGTLFINKRICIIGEGYKPKGGATPKTNVFGTFTFSSISSNGSNIWGIDGDFFYITINSTTRLNNIAIRRNRIHTITLPDSSFNITIAENIITNGITFTYNSSTNFAKHVNLKILNNVFVTNGSAQCLSQAANFYSYQVKNNLFLYGSFGSPFASNPIRIFNSINSSTPRCQNAIFENNIFYNTLPALNDASIGRFGPISCSFINNITLSAGTNPLLSTLTLSGHSFSGNLDNTDPGYTNLFTNILANRIITDYDLFNIRIPNSSPAKNAGSDGTDIGPTGGAYPIYNGVPLTEQLSGEPPLPQVRNASFTNNVNAVQTGGSLQINVTGRKRN